MGVQSHKETIMEILPINLGYRKEYMWLLHRGVAEAPLCNLASSTPGCGRTRMSVRADGMASLEVLRETEPGYGGKTKDVQEEKREEEIGPLVHCEVRAVAAVDGEAEFA